MMSVGMAQKIKDGIDTETEFKIRKTEEDVENYYEESVLLTESQAETLKSILKAVLEIRFARFIEISSEDCEESEYDFESITRLCSIYNELNNGNRFICHENVVKLTIELDYDIFEVIRNDVDIDNAWWLWQVMEVWHILAEKSGVYK